MISNSSKYAIKAVLYLALHSNENLKIMAKDIAEPINAPLPYISKILQELARKDLISSRKGPKGGFFLSPENRQQSVMDIVRVIEGESRLHACILDLEKCNLDRPCPLHNVVYPTKSKLIDYLSNETIDSFTKKYKSVDSYFKKA